MCDDLRYVIECKGEMWSWFSELIGPVGGSASEIRGKALWSSLASLAYCYRDSFEQLRTVPLSLTQGDIRANVEWLATAEMDSLQGGVSRSMRMCLEMGVEASVLVDTSRLARESPCCTNLVEQGHGSRAATLKAHSQFGTRSLQARALFSDLPGGRLVERLDGEIAKKTKAISGPRYTAQLAYLKYLQTNPYGERPDGMDAMTWSRRRMAKHRGKFASLPWAEQIEFQTEADLIDAQRRHVWQQELGDFKERRSLVRSQLQEGLRDAVARPNLVSSHRLGDEDLQRCADVVASIRSSMTLEDMREELLQSVEEPSQDLLDDLKERSTILAVRWHRPLRGIASTSTAPPCIKLMMSMGASRIQFICL